MKGRIIVIGASFGGISALVSLAKLLPAALPAAVLVAQHTSPDGASALPEILTRAGALTATHARDNELLCSGRIYVAPPDRHLLVGEGGYLNLSHGPKENWTRPAVDPMFRSAALVYGPAVVGVVLSGYLDDGTAGLSAIKDRGGIAIAQDPAEASAPSMPSSALRHVAVDHCGTIERIAAILIELANDAPGDDPSRGQVVPIAIEDLSPMAPPDGLPRSAFNELGDKRLLRYRCRAGHAFTHATCWPVRPRFAMICSPPSKAR